MKTALRVNTDFTTEVLDLEAREYEQLSGAVGGLIQSVALLNGLEIVVNEEGKLIDRKSTRLNSSHIPLSRMPSSA